MFHNESPIQEPYDAPGWLIGLLLAALAAAVVALLALTLAAVAWGKPPPGADLSGAEHAWWECNKRPGGFSCCSVADGHVLKDDDWRLQDSDKGPIYQVRVEGTWYNIPTDSVINETAQCGSEPNAEMRSMAKVWYSPTNVGTHIINIKVWCFMAGTEY